MTENNSENNAEESADTWQLCGKTLHSRLLLGTGGMTSIDIMEKSLVASGAEVATVALRRHAKTGVDIYGMLQRHNINVLPNTAGCKTAHDAVLTAKMARESLGTDWIKLEVIADDDTLLPDTREVLLAAEKLVEEGFSVLCYTNDDPIVARRLVSLGVKAVMPGGAPIGTGLGILNPRNIELIVRECKEDGVPVILDAGVGTASDVVKAFEIGCSGVLLASAVTRCPDPVKMGRAMAAAVTAGKLAHDAGRIPMRNHALASSPVEGRAWADSVL